MSLLLLSLLLSFSSISIVSGGRSTMGSALSFMLDIVESEETSASQRCKAFNALDAFVDEANQDHWDDYHDKDEFHERIIIVCVSELKHRVTTSDSSHISNAKLGRLMMNSIIGNNVVDRLIDDERFFPWLLDGICTGEAEEHMVFSSVLAKFVTASSKENRVTTLVRYFPGLHSAFKCIFSRCAVSVSIINEYFSIHSYDGVEFAGIIATMPSVLGKWAEKTTEKDKTEVCDIIIDILEISIESTSTLQQLLGTDLLSISSHLSHLPISTSYPYLYSSHQADKHADVFRRILRIHPEFSQQFRNWTNDGVRGNPIADIGRSIPPKDLTRQGANYIFYEEDNEE